MNTTKIDKPVFELFICDRSIGEFYLHFRYEVYNEDFKMYGYRCPSQVEVKVILECTPVENIHFIREKWITCDYGYEILRIVSKTELVKPVGPLGIPYKTERISCYEDEPWEYMCKRWTTESFIFKYKDGDNEKVLLEIKDKDYKREE